MGEHGTWFDFLNRFSWWQSLHAQAEHYLGRGPGSEAPFRWMMFQDTHFTLTHVLITFVVLLFVLFGSLRFKAGLATPDQGLVPPRKMNLRNFFEYTAESVYGMVEGAMGEKSLAFPLQIEREPESATAGDQHRQKGPESRRHVFEEERVELDDEKGDAISDEHSRRALGAEPDE